MSAADSNNRDRVAGLVPAAGASRRMGTDKRRLRHGERRVIEVTVAALCQGGLRPVVVVLEPGSPCVELPGLRGDDVELTVNPAPDRGMLSSIRAGLAALPGDVAAVAVQPGDHPFVPAAVVALLREHYLTHRPLLLVPRYVAAGRRGHPLLIDRRLFGEAAACDDAVGLRQLLSRRATDVVELPLQDPQLADADADLDRPEDTERLDTRPAKFRRRRSRE